MYAVLIFFAAYYLMPVYMLLITALKPFENVGVTKMWTLPTSLYMDNWFRAVPLLAPNFFNSVMITVPAALISSAIGSLNG
jgi:glucose/mannose transport system permease protein